MVSRSIFSLAVLAIVVVAQDKKHPVKTINEPPATPQEAVFNTGKIVGKFTFVPSPKGGAQVTLMFESGLDLDTALAPSKGYDYHIHVNPVGPGNNCGDTGGHLDPANVGAAKCNPTTPDKCQEGDLSGKHGEIKGTSTGAIDMITYLDRSIAFGTGPHSIERRSVVIHNNGTRIACANILPEGTSPVAPPTDDSTSGSKGDTDDNLKAAGLPSSSASNILGMSAAAMGLVTLTMVLGF